MTVSMADVSTRLNLSSEQEAEKYIRDMVREDGERWERILKEYELFVIKQAEGEKTNHNLV